MPASSSSFAAPSPPSDDPVVRNMMQLAQWSIDHPDEVTKPWSRAAIKSLIVAYVADLYESSTVLSPESRVLSP